jgi:hypothetical protein
MKPALNVVAMAVAAASLWTGAALAVPLYGGIAGSTNGDGYIFQPEGPQAVNASNAHCANNYCIATTVKASQGGLGAYYYQGGAGNYPSAGNGSAGALARGSVEVIPLQLGGPSFIQATLRLELSGATRGEAVGAATASGGYAISAGVNGWGDASYKEFFTFGQPSQPVQALNLEHPGDGLYLAHLSLPVGAAFDLRLTLEAFGAANGSGGHSLVEAAYEHTLVLAHNGPVFILPSGYSAQSQDWGVQDNQWCGQACGAPPVPEPGTLVLFLAGLWAVGMRRERAD